MMTNLDEVSTPCQARCSAGDIDGLPCRWSSEHGSFSRWSFWCEASDHWRLALPERVLSFCRLLHHWSTHTLPISGDWFAANFATILGIETCTANFLTARGWRKVDLLCRSVAAHTLLDPWKVALKFQLQCAVPMFSCDSCPGVR